MATFGDQTAYTSKGSISNSIHGCYAHSGQAGIAASITALLSANASGSSLIKCALYRAVDDGFVAETEERNISLTTSRVWHTLIFPSPPTLIEQAYYIVVWAKEGIPSIYVAITETVTPYKMRVYRTITYGEWPDPSGLSVSSGSASIYCTLEIDPSIVTTQDATGIGKGVPP